MTVTVSKHSSTVPKHMDNGDGTHIDICIPLAANTFAAGQLAVTTAAALFLAARRLFIALAARR